MTQFRPALAAAATVAIALALVGCAPKPAATPASTPSAATASPADVAYCDQLASLYERYGSAQDQRGEDFDVSVAEAINQCHSGNPDAGIATLSRLLKEQDFTLPPRPGK
jgi:Flp pilus assembly protein TadD